MLALSNGWVAVIAAAAALLGALLTAGIQIFIEWYRRKQDRRDRNTELKRDVFLRFLRFSAHLAEDFTRRFSSEQGADEFRRSLAEQVTDFMVELRLYGSDKVRRVVSKEFYDVQGDYIARVKERLDSELDVRSIEASPAGVDVFREQANQIIENTYREMLHPGVLEITRVMRAELKT